MITNLTGILSKLLVVIIIIILFFIINKYLYNNNLETFDTQSTDKEQITYNKLNETYIEPNSKTLDILYTNYSGEEVGKDVWLGKTLDQCTDTCNKMEKCIGFSRDAVLDSEPGNCYPRSEISECHSNRKGNPSQIQNAIKFNSYFKSNVANSKNNLKNNWKNLCIGDMDMTLNRTIFLKSYIMPTKYIGNMGGDNVAVLVNKKDKNFNKFCNFRIEMGKDGIGTVSFLHIDTNKYLYRDENGLLIVKDISSGKTIDKQRASFNIYDGISQSIMLHPMSFDGETTSKFVVVNNNNLNVEALESVKNANADIEPEKKRQSAMFYIVDTILESKIISGKDSGKDSEKDSENIKEGFEVKLNSSNDLPIYYNLFNTPDYINIDNYLNDNYNKNIKIGLMNSSIDKKLNDIIIKKEISKLINKNEIEYNELNDLNGEIEKQIYKLTYKMNNNNDFIENNLDKMKLTDMANDYFFLKFLNK